MYLLKFFSINIFVEKSSVCDPPKDKEEEEAEENKKEVRKTKKKKKKKMKEQKKKMKEQKNMIKNMKMMYRGRTRRRTRRKRRSHAVKTTEPNKSFLVSEEDDMAAICKCLERRGKVWVLPQQIWLELLTTKSSVFSLLHYYPQVCMDNSLGTSISSKNV